MQICTVFSFAMHFVPRTLHFAGLQYNAPIARWKGELACRADIVSRGRDCLARSRDPRRWWCWRWSIWRSRWCWWWSIWRSRQGDEDVDQFEDDGGDDDEDFVGGEVVGDVDIYIVMMYFEFTCNLPHYFGRHQTLFGRHLWWWLFLGWLWWWRRWWWSRW